jgi:WD40-like Beta Propeller Repeat
MKNGFLLCVAFFVFFAVNVQQVQWANKLIKFSSDLGGKQHGIKRILGKPDVYPQGGSSPNAWTPKKALDGYEWVEVGFEKPQTVKQVAIFENLNAGCVVSVAVDDGSGKYKRVWSRKPNYKTVTFKATIPSDRNYYFKRKRRKIQDSPDVVNPGVEYAILEEAVSGVVAVRVEFNFALLPGQKEVDAIGISDSETPIQPSVNTTPTFENFSSAQILTFPDIEPSSCTVSADGNKFFVAAIGDDKNEIYSFTKEASGKWSNKKPEPSLSPNGQYNYVRCIGHDLILKGGSMYTKGTTETGFELFAENNGDYQNLEHLKVAAYNNYDDSAEAFLTTDRKVLIMGIETDFSHGAGDLYFAQLKEDGTYGFLQNMGKVINSAADEGMCQLLSDNKTMLFSSNGFSAFGSFDIFITYRLDDTWKNWSEPSNLGSKVNTSDFDGLPFYDEKNEVLYFISTVNGSNVLKYISIPKTALLKSN